MSLCPTLTFQVTNVPKTHTKYISNKFPFKFTLWNRHVYILHTFTLNMKPVFPIGKFEKNDRNKIIILH